MKMQFVLLVLSCLFPAFASAQTVGPVLNQFQGAADSQIIVTNNSLVPQVVQMEPLGFTVENDTGMQQLKPLGPEVKISMSESSFRLAAKQSKAVMYHATCLSADACWFLLYATFSDAQTKKSGDDEKVRVALHIPAVVYVSKGSAKKNQVSVSIDGNRVILRNNSTRLLTRVSGAETYTSNGIKHTLIGFPLFPQGTPGNERVFILPEAPSYVVAKFSGFTIDTRKGN